jgi:aryl-alcohol dehydrogenase-like predicted oxidoreductase
LAWLISKPYHASAIIGPETIEELEASVPAMDLTLDADQLSLLDELLPPPPNWESWYEEYMAQQTAALG